jgi:hypothetical protein
MAAGNREGQSAPGQHVPIRDAPSGAPDLIVCVLWHKEDAPFTLVECRLDPEGAGPVADRLERIEVTKPLSVLDLGDLAIRSLLV